MDNNEKNTGIISSKLASGALRRLDLSGGTKPESAATAQPSEKPRTMGGLVPETMTYTFAKRAGLTVLSEEKWSDEFDVHGTEVAKIEQLLRSGQATPIQAVTEDEVWTVTDIYQCTALAMGTFLGEKYPHSIVCAAQQVRYEDNLDGQDMFAKDISKEIDNGNLMSLLAEFQWKWVADLVPCLRNSSGNALMVVIRQLTSFADFDKFAEDFIIHRFTRYPVYSFSGINLPENELGYKRMRMHVVSPNFNSLTYGC